MNRRARLGELGPNAEAVDALIERARATVAFYGHHLAGTEGRAFHELPTCSKADLTGWGPRPLDADSRGGIRYCATSGTTGPRLVIGFSADDWDRLGDRLGRRGQMVGLGEGDLVANTHGYGLWIGGPSLELMVLRSGAAVLPVGPGSPDQLATWLTDLPITAMSATPSLVRVLAERASADLDAGRWQLRLGLIGGEGSSIELRRQATAAIGGSFRWQELYGATEVGGPTLGWGPPDEPDAGRLLVDTDEHVVELLHPGRDEPVGDGEVGEITVTTPWRESSPLVRYRTRDLSVSLPHIEDSSGYPSMWTIVGRVDDAIKVRGALVYPAVVEALVVGSCPPGAEWRILLDREPGRFDTMALVVEHDAADAGGLAALVSDRLGVRVEVTAVAPGSLPRFHGKAARVEDRRG